MDKEWHAGFHDSTLLGWITAIAYLVLAILSLRVLLRHIAKEERLTWIALTAFFILLAINKQLDLQTWLSVTGRNYTRSHDLYEHREYIRLAFVTLLGLGSLVTAFFFRKRICHFLTHHRLLTIGLGFIALYILIRALKFKNLGPLSFLELLPETWQWTIEALGIALIAFSLLPKTKITS